MPADPKPQRHTLRNSLRANLFDGDEAGEVTYKISKLLDDVVFEVALWMVEMADVRNRMEKYYVGDAEEAPDA